MNVTLIIVIIGLILLGLWGWFSGFIKMVCVLCSSILVFVLTIFLSPITTGIMTDSEKIYGFFYEKVAGSIELPEFDSDNALDFLDSIEVNEELKGNIREGIEGITGDISGASDDAGEYIRDRVTRVVIKVVAFIITYIIVSIIVGIVFMLFKIIARIPVVNMINRILGVVVGLALGYFLICLVFSIGTYITTWSIGADISADIKSSAILSWINDRNILSSFIGNYLD